MSVDRAGELRVPEPARGPRPGSGAMFDGIAPRYDLLNRLLSLGLDQRWRRAAVDALACPHGGTVLDVATGTADMALLALRRWPGIEVRGVDPSLRMLGFGAEKVGRAGVSSSVQLLQGEAERLPFADQSFDASMIAFGIRNVPDRSRGLGEMARVTRRGGRIVVLELTEPQTGALATLSRLHVRHVVPLVGALLSGWSEYRYLQNSIAAFPPADKFADAMHDAGIAGVRVRRLSFGACHLFVGSRS